jgi:hypothetical protein
MKKQLIIISAALFIVAACSEPELPAHFKDLLQRASLIFTEPAGLNRIEPIANKVMNYEMAYLHPGKRFEIRYAIRPMDELLKEFQERESKKQEGDINIHPNQLYQKTFLASLLNISNGQIPDYTVYDALSAKNDFNADWGATAITSPNESFGQDYKYCLIVFLHKHNLGDAFIFFLSDDREMLINDMRTYLFNMKFYTQN